MKLRISGTFDVHGDCSLEEAIFRLSVRLKQISARNENWKPDIPDDWHGTLELTDD